MKALKILLWVFDTVVFVAIAIYRSATGYWDASYGSYTNSWFSDLYYIGGETVTVYDEPFFIVCMIIMALYLLVSIVTKIKGIYSETLDSFKVVAYIAAVVSVSFMYSGDWDWLIVSVIGILSTISDFALSNKASSK